MDLTPRPLTALIITALPVEYLAMREHLSDVREETHERGTIYERGKFICDKNKWDVIIVEIGQGNVITAAEAERAIDHFSPAVTLFVGVAGGLKDVSIGDVVAATKVYSYEYGKALDQFRPRFTVRNSSYRLEQRARAEAKKGDWIKRLNTLNPDLHFKAYVGPIATGSKVIASTSSETFTLLRQNCSDALAVEMEGHGLLEAVHINDGTEALVIRGISDLVDGKTEADASGSQELAAKNASAFALEILAKYDPPNHFKADQAVKTASARSADPANFEAPAENFVPDHRVEELIRDIGIGEWDKAQVAALIIVKATDQRGSNPLFESLLRYPKHPTNEELRWASLLTIESVVEAAPCLLPTEHLRDMAFDENFEIRSSAASICMTLAQFAPSIVPTDILFQLARYDEDWYVMAPASAALKTMARGRRTVLQYFLNEVFSNDPDAVEFATRNLLDIARVEPEILDPEDLKYRLTHIREQGDKESMHNLERALRLAKEVKRANIWKYGL